MNPIYPKNAAAPAAFYSPGIATKDIIFLSGQVALTPSGEFINESFDAEVQQVFDNIDALLESAGCQKKDIIKATVLLDDINDYQQFNDLYKEYMKEIETPPARTCIEVAALPLGAKVEIEIIAQNRSSKSPSQ